MPSAKTRTGLLALLAVALACAVAYWAWSAHRKAELRRNVAALVQDASARLREALQQERGPADGAAIRGLESEAKALDPGLAELERAGAREHALVYAAEEYTLAARQLLRDLAREQRERRRVAESIELLSRHMNRANRRAPDWHRNALRLKDDLEKTYFDYGLAAEALARELDAFPDARATLAAQIGDSPLLDDAVVAGAGGRARDAAKRVADEMRRARRMAGP
jgi:uncharacterized membrane protein YccC